MYLLLQFTMVVYLEIFLWTSLPRPQPWLVNYSPRTKIFKVSEYVGYTQNMYLLLQFTMVVHREIFLWTSLPLPQPWLVNFSSSTKIFKVSEYVGYTRTCTYFYCLLWLFIVKYFYGQVCPCPSLGWSTIHLVPKYLRCQIT